VSRRSGERILDVEINEPLTWHDYAVEWVLGAALVFSPLAYGSTNAWAQQILYGLIAVMAVIAAAKFTLVRGSRVVLTWAYLPIVLYLLVVTLSVIPLPAGLVKTISPGTVEEKTRLLSDLPSVQQVLSHLTITFNVWSTLQGLRMVLALSVVFVVIVNICQTPAQITRILAMVAIAGAIVALLALAQDVTQNSGQPQRIYWNLPLISVEAVHQNAGPFAGHAQLGQYLNLTIGAMMALALVQIGNAFYGEDPTGREVLERLNSTGIRIAIILLIGMAAAAVAIAWSVSRGATIGLVIAGLVSMALLLVKRGWRKGETVVLINVVLALVIVAAVGYVLLERGFLQRTGDAKQQSLDRLEIVKSMGPMIVKWPVMGTGLESFEWVYPMFQRSGGGNSFFTHAENDYAQTLSDTGIVGGVLTLGFLVIVFVNWLKAFFGRRPIQLAAVGIAFSLIAVMIHSAADFSQRTPAVALVTTVLVALTISLSRLAVQSESTESVKPTFGWMPLPRIVVAVIAIGAMGWSIWSLNNVRIAEILSWQSDPTVYFLDAKPSDPDFEKQLHEYFRVPIADNVKAVALDPMNVEYIHELNHFRWRELSGRRDETTAAIIYPPDAAEVGQKIEQELSAARVLCPCFGRLHTLLGKIQWDLGDKELGEKNLQIARKLRPADGEPVFYLCEIASDQDRWDDALSLAKECYSREGHNFGRLLVNLLAREHRHPELAFEVVKNDDLWLGELFSAVKPDGEQKVLYDQIQARLLELEKKAVVETPARGEAWLTLARRQRDAGNTDEAVDAFNQAIVLDAGNINARMELARFLVTIGRNDEATKQLDMCLRLSPQLDEAKNMLKTLSSLPPRPSGP